ncbi:MAG: hypothetical protein JWP81_1976 [Ferruginibacter sp.]|nr:hypothetical protein [Ferruginibacter sp.]
MIARKIKIGITFTGTDEKHSNYLRWLKGNEPIDIVTLSPLATNLDSIANLDGIVLSGGIDMHPKYYHCNITRYPNAPDRFNEKRDAFEVAIFRLSQENHLPVLGVCRGMQLANCVLGGTLTQDIGPEGNVIHRYEHNDKAHGVNILPGTLMKAITGIERSVVNSAHHQCIEILADGLTTNCISDDGIIEGVEWADPQNKPFFLGVQWHPERMFKLNLGDSPVTKNIRDRFIREIKQHIENNK